MEMGLFHHRIRDAIANVPITDPAEAAAIAGTVPPGGTVAQRRNVAEARVPGIESRLRFAPDEWLAFQLAWLWSRSEFEDSRRQPLLEGKPFPQSPEHRLLAEVEFAPLESLRCFAGIEAGSHQFDDALASRRIGSFWSLRIGAAWQYDEHLTLHARLENLLDEEIVTGLSSDGIRSTGTPRSFWLGAEWRW